MIVQITRTRNGLFLIKEMLEIWKNYADGFVFLDDRSTDGTYDFLIENISVPNVVTQSVLLSSSIGILFTIRYCSCRSFFSF
jgi:hypothetical protein